MGGKAAIALGLVAGIAAGGLLVGGILALTPGPDAPAATVPPTPFPTATPSDAPSSAPASAPASAVARGIVVARRTTVRLARGVRGGRGSQRPRAASHFRTRQDRASRG